MKSCAWCSSTGAAARSTGCTGAQVHGAGTDALGQESCAVRPHWAGTAARYAAALRLRPGLLFEPALWRQIVVGFARRWHFNRQMAKESSS